MFRMVWSCSFLATVLRCCLHIFCMYRLSGNFVYFAKYSLSMAVVSWVSLNVLLVCPLCPVAVNICVSKLMSFCCVSDSSIGISPVSMSVLKIGAYFLAWLITFIMFSLVGMFGIFLSNLYFGRFHSIWFISAK